MSLKKYFLKYTFEIIVIVMGISISFFIEDVRQKNELKMNLQTHTSFLFKIASQISIFLLFFWHITWPLFGFVSDIQVRTHPL